MTPTEQRIEHVAALIASTPDRFRNFAAVVYHNDYRGWSYEVRWAAQYYGADTDYTRVEGDHLSSEMISTAWKTAQAWLS